MNEEENKTFEFVKNCLKTGNIEDFQDIDKYDIETLLNLISKLQKELDKKDKVIDLMAKKLYKHGFFVIEPVKRYDVESELYIKTKTKEEIKEFFYKKVEEENE